VDSRVKIMEPRAHRLPWQVMWAITILTAVGMAILNFVTVLCMRTLVQCKFHLMQNVTDRAGVAYGTLALVGCAMTTATICTCLIHYFSPEAGASGAPENKGWLNGSSPHPSGGYTKTHLVVRGLATILGNASGYPVGREGPTVSMGSNLAFLIADWLARPYVHQMLKLGADTPQFLILDEERIAHAKRVACAVGGACGMAMIFDAPIGGIIYMFEEVTAFCWPLELTFRAFVGTVVCSLLSRAFLNACGSDVKAFVIYEWSPQQHAWGWWDVPFFILLAAVLGIFSAIHTRMCLRVGTLRQRAMATLGWAQPYAKMTEAVLYAALCALVCALVAQMGRCEPLREAAAELVRYNCREGEYNPVASLLLTTSEGAVNLLFSRRNSGAIHPTNELLAFIAYTALNIGLTGVPVPSGNFTGTMLIGGLVGRGIGAVAMSNNLSGPATSGVYAMVGSAAMLCGFKRMSIAVVVFVATASNDFTLVPPLMVAVVVSMTISKACLARGYDEEQILRRKVPYLDPEPPPALDSLKATDLIDKLPPEARLPPEAKAGLVARALEAKEVFDFPVLRGNVCVGFTTRERLESALRGCAHPRDGGELSGRSLEDGGAKAPLARHEDLDDGEEGELGRLISGSLISGIGVLSVSANMPVDKLVDPVPYTVLEDMPAPRIYALFAKAGMNTACVVSEANEFRGMISRKGLIANVRRLEHQD